MQQPTAICRFTHFMMLSRYLRFSAFYVVLCLCALPVHAKRIALVMGNDNYQHVAKLQKAGNDAVAMATELRAAGFEVVLHKDLNYRGMVKAMESLYTSITGGDEVVVFFAGHGVQLKNGSFLLPIDIEASSESEVEKTSYGLNDMMDQLGQAKATFSLVLLDACRDNPLKTKGRNVGGTSRGLGPPDPPKGQMVVYSASRGQQALDRLSDADNHPNSVFTREFISRMRKPGLKLEELVREIQDSVERLARTVSHEQRPAMYNEARGNFYFFGPSTGGSAAVASGAGSINEALREDRFWDDTKSAGNRDGFEAYLDQYPKGRYANLARANINRLIAAGGAVAVSAAPAVNAALASVASVDPNAPPPRTAVGGQIQPNDLVLAALSPQARRVTKLNMPNGDRYEGEAIGVIRTGKGIYTFANGDKYDGDLLDNFFHGKGTQTYLNGDVYTGDFQRSVKTGQGTYRYNNGDKYEGGFLNNLLHGKGVQTYKSGDTYEGEYENGNKQGRGIYRFANGDRFEGNFVENLFNGKGLMVFANGDRYEGDFFNNAKNGKGIHFFASKDRYEGTFQAGVQAGAGTHFYSNGDKFVGQFANGVRHGKGLYSFAGGQTKPQEFDYGAEKAN
jgi:hypothetical protein